jgi:CheY-like chemotaxis protein
MASELSLSYIIGMEKKTNLLIVDDDTDDRSLFIEAVRDVDENIQCTEARNGEEALELLNNSAAALPDCIFLDLRMPRLSGKKCLQQIKTDERLKNIPVYIYTTSRGVEESAELKQMGALHFISKPNSEEDVYYLVAMALEELLHPPNNDHLNR